MNLKYLKYYPFNFFIDVYKIKKLSNIRLLKELPFYDELKSSKIKLHLVIVQEVIR